MKDMKYKLTAREEEIMNLFWDRGPMFVKEIVPLYDDVKPHFNTVSTIVRGLEEKGFLSHEAFGTTFRYYAVVSREEFGAKSLTGLIGKYYNNSLLSAVSALVADEDISEEELKELISLVKNKK